MNKILKNGLFLAALDYLIKEKLVVSQKDFAEKIGVSPNTITRIKHDDVEVSDDTIRAMNNAFGSIFNVNYFRGRSAYMLTKDLDHYNEHPEEFMDEEKAKKRREIGSALKLWIETNFKNKVEFAKKLDVTPQYVNGLCSGRTIGKDMAYRLQNTFGLSAVFLLTGEGEIERSGNLIEQQPIDNSSLVNALLAAKDETIDSLRREIKAKDDIITLLRQQLLQHPNAIFTPDFPFPNGTAEPRSNNP